jgi:prepilin-type N-terminal cleavage/methylation domain-containing protein
MRRPASTSSVRANSGYTLVELLVAMSVGLVLLFAILAFIERASRSQESTANRSEQLTQARTGFNRMVREIRDAAYFKLLTSQVAEVATPVQSRGTGTYSGNLRLVRYDCSSSQRCVRQEGPVGGSLGPGATLFTDVQNADVFTPVPDFLNPNYVAVDLHIGVPHSASIVLQDGVTLRNQPPAQ